MRIAIVDPDATTSDVLAFAAQRRGHQSVCLSSFDELHERLPFTPTLIVLGQALKLERIDPVERIRATFPDAVVLIAMERPKEPLPSRLLVAGANEVVRTPVSPIDLLIRAETWVSSKGSKASVTEGLQMGDLELELDRYVATKNGIRLNLTKLELRLLYCLCEHSPHLTPTERLLTFGWDTLGDPDAALIKTHISHIRKKLRDAGGVDFEITSRQTLGYTLQVHE